MSTVAISHHIIMSILQKQNIKREIAKKVTIMESILPNNKEEKTNIKIILVTNLNGAFRIYMVRY